MKNHGWMAEVRSCAMVVNLPLKVREYQSRTHILQALSAILTAVIKETGATDVEPMADAPPR